MKLVKNDQYYTRSNVAVECIDQVDIDSFDYIIEPSAGRGDFFKHLPAKKRLGYDIEPKYSGIIKKDFFEVTLNFLDEINVLTIGNPPFGKNSNLAYAFFQKAAQYSDCIAFIVPRTFRKPSMINRLDKRFHLIKETLLKEEAFYLDTNPKAQATYSVPCVFQVWEKRNNKREKIKQKLIHKDFDFVLREDANLAIQRVGVNAGKTYAHNIESKSKESHYFIYFSDQKVKNVFQYIWKRIWDPKLNIKKTSSKYDTAGNPSISKAELVQHYEKMKKRNILNEIFI